MPDARSLALAAAGSLLAAAGAVVWLTHGDAVSVTADPGARATTPPPVGTTALPVRAAPEPGAPRRVLIPALGVSAPVMPVTAPDRTLVPPADPDRLGWWADGAKPGAREGSALIAGHTVHTGGGALDDLEELEAGDEVVVRTDRGTVRYTVDRVRVYSKGRIADDATRLFSQDSPGRLVLITCEDWDGTRYLSNVVVTAVPD
ncbi:class F sortase [Nocardioides sp. SR21]|uniref:class F sortase n=1 Tax=Nocardioides sp. SR21 TaxID=2919501 RepID=UPI001FAB3387|nr:class F sortase [Nocardioides sp. SR21]